MIMSDEERSKARWFPVQPVVPFLYWTLLSSSHTSWTTISYQVKGVSEVYINVILSSTWFSYQGNWTRSYGGMFNRSFAKYRVCLLCKRTFSQALLSPKTHLVPRRFWLMSRFYILFSCWYYKVNEAGKGITDLSKHPSNSRPPTPTFPLEALVQSPIPSPIL